MSKLHSDPGYKGVVNESPVDNLYHVNLWLNPGYKYLGSFPTKIIAEQALEKA